ncbi:hypothetical protein HID58_004655 [Brassica napus]|uniref:Uncharacterized protein n=1 Tax=Brassica napus TaxID=3708 RepID=A0ABQ8E6F0_BRANA|nr:hypothetical protein HID58_004655 [Brassica napus]
MTKTLIAVVGAILSELPINHSRLLDTINRMPLREMSCSCGREGSLLRRSVLLLQLFKKCFLIFDHADRPRSLATRMVVAGGFNIARTSSVKLGFILIHELGKPRNIYGGVCTNALEAADQALVTPVGEVARQVSLLETGSDKRTAKPCSLGRTRSDSSHRVRDKI